MIKLNNIVKNELLNPSIDLAADYSNIAIDSLTDSEILAEIPIVKTIAAGTKITLAIKERFFVKKLLNFLSEFHKGEVDPEKYIKFKNKIKFDDDYKDKVLEVLTIMIERYIEVNQSKIMANLFKEYINGSIDWDRFYCLCIVLERLHPLSYRTLFEMSLKSNIDLSYSFWGSKAGKPPEDKDIYKLTVEEEAILLSAGIVSPSGTHYIVSPLGKDLFKYGIRRLFK